MLWCVSVVEELLSNTWNSNQRLLLWGHSHGGNLLALFSNLICASSKAIEKFFSATESHFSDSVLGKLGLPVWNQMQNELSKGDVVDRLPKMDFVTFGTPIRYRFQRDVCANLLHFVQHRSLDSKSPAKATLPTSIQDLSAAAGRRLCSTVRHWRYRLFPLALSLAKLEMRTPTPRHA